MASHMAWARILRSCNDPRSIPTGDTPGNICRSCAGTLEAPGESASHMDPASVNKHLRLLYVARFGIQQQGRAMGWVAKSTSGEELVGSVV